MASAGGEGPARGDRRSRRKGGKPVTIDLPADEVFRRDAEAEARATAEGMPPAPETVEPSQTIETDTAVLGSDSVEGGSGGEAAAAPLDDAGQPIAGAAADTDTPAGSRPSDSVAESVAAPSSGRRPRRPGWSPRRSRRARRLGPLRRRSRASRVRTGTP